MKRPGDDEPQAPDGRVFEELAVPALDRLYRFACRLERDRDRAADLLQDALVVGFRKFRQLEDHRSFEAWMMAVIRTQFLNRRARRAHDPLELEHFDLPATADSADPEHRFLARRFSLELAAALDGLPLEQRLAVHVVDVEGLSYAEASKALGAPPGTVASRVARGRRALRRSLVDLARDAGLGGLP